MRRNWLLLGIALLVAVLAIGAVACSDDDDDDNGDEPEATEVIDDGDGDGDGDGDLLLRLAVTLVEEGGSGASGDAELSLNGDGILVSISMSGLTGEVHPNHLHHGTCADPGEIHITLDNIVSDESGAGSQTTANDEESLTHFETGHYLAVHQSEDDDAVVACGDVVASAA